MNIFSIRESVVTGKCSDFLNLWISSLIFFSVVMMAEAQGIWVRKADFPGSSRHLPVSFSIGKKGYFGLGQKQADLFTFKVYDDFWEYDPEKDTWTQKADFPGGGRIGAKGFTVHGKGYAGFGYFIMPNGPNAGGNDYQPDFYAFDPDSNAWSAMNKKYLSANDQLFVIKDTVWSVNPEFRTVNRYDFIADQWEQKEWERKALAPAYTEIRGSGASFILSGQCYLVTALKNKKNTVNQLWSVNPSALAWELLNTLPGSGNDTLSAFTSGNNAFILLGKKEIYQFDPVTVVWTAQKTGSKPNNYLSPLFSIEEKTYFLWNHEFWEFTP